MLALECAASGFSTRYLIEVSNFNRLRNRERTGRGLVQRNSGLNRRDCTVSR